MQEPDDISKRIKDSGLTIYDALDEQPDLKLPTVQLEKVLQKKLAGLKLDQPIRTRSKVVKSAICSALGYPVPRSFRKTKPRFPGQDFDVYVQKSDNLQIWNEELSSERRYVLIRISEDDLVTRVRVITGNQLAKLDTTGTLTKKYQASAIDKVESSRLVSVNDTPDLMWAMQANANEFNLVAKEGKAAEEYFGKLLPTDKLYVRLVPLLGQTINNPGADQERNRGWELHRVVSKQLGIAKAEDDGQVPDVAEQLLELKLQTSPTVDLGLMKPNSKQRLASYFGLRHHDIRYAIFYATPFKNSDGENQLRLDHLVITSGADFFCFFRQLQGNVINTKNQIRLPKDFFKKK